MNAIAPAIIAPNQTETADDWLIAEAMRIIENGGHARIRADQDGTFTFDPDGFEAIVSEVEDWYGDLIDLVAWRASSPREWYVRIGQAPILGLDALRRASQHGWPLQVLTCPAAVVAARNVGAVQASCVLDWKFFPAAWLFDAEIECGEAVRAKLIEANRRAHRPWLDIKTFPQRRHDA